MRLFIILSLLLNAANMAYAEPKGLQLEQQKQWTEARRAWQKELAEHPHNLDARYHLAQLLEKSGHIKDAQALYQKNIGLGNHLNSYIASVQAYLQQGKPKTAEILLQQATKHFKHEAVFWYLLADLSIQNKHSKQAEKYFQKALQADPLNGFAHLRYGRFLSHQKQHQAALKQAHKALKLLPLCAPCWQIYADILIAAKRPQDALQAYQQSLAIQPNSLTRQKLIDLLHQLGKHQRAKRMQQGLDAWQAMHRNAQSIQ